MQKIFFNLKKYHNKIAFIDNNFEKYNYSFIIDHAKKFKKCIKNRSLILMIGSNQAASAIGYISFLKLNYILILLDESFSDQYIKKLIQIYKPEYIYGEDQRLKQINLKDHKLKCLNFLLYKTKYKKNNKINKKNLLLISTSGSTNSPKFVRLSNINLIDNTKKIINYLNINSTHKTITTMPFGYSYGLSIINSHIESGGTIIFNKKNIFEKNFWKIVRKYKITSFGGVPSFYELLRKLKFDKTFSPNIKYLTQAGLPYNEQVAQARADIVELSNRVMRLVTDDSRFTNEDRAYINRITGLSAMDKIQSYDQVLTGVRQIQTMLEDRLTEISGQQGMKASHEMSVAELFDAYNNYRKVNKIKFNGSDTFTIKTNLPKLNKEQFAKRLEVYHPEVFAQIQAGEFNK